MTKKELDKSFKILEMKTRINTLIKDLKKSKNWDEHRIIKELERIIN